MFKWKSVSLMDVSPESNGGWAVLITIKHLKMPVFFTENTATYLQIHDLTSQQQPRTVLIVI